MAMPTRAEALATLDEGWTQVEALIERLTDEQACEPKTIGGGEWSAKDLIAHLAFWEELAVEALEQRRAGERPRIEDVFAAGAEGIDAENAGNYERSAPQTIEEIVARATRARQAVVGAIWSMSDSEWDAPATYSTTQRVRTGELLGSILGAPRKPFAHAFAHIPDLQARVDEVS
jgi:hypothetical protein